MEESCVLENWSHRCGITFGRFLFGLHQGEIDLDGLLQ